MRAWPWRRRLGARCRTDTRNLPYRYGESSHPRPARRWPTTSPAASRSNSHGCRDACKCSGMSLACRLPHILRFIAHCICTPTARSLRGKLGLSLRSATNDDGSRRGWRRPFRDDRYLRIAVAYHVVFSRRQSRRRERREQAAVGLQVDERRPIEAVKTPDQERRPPPLDQRRQRRPDRVRADRRAQRKRAARLTIIGRALAHEITPRLLQPIEDLDPLDPFDPRQPRDPGLSDFDAADGAIASPLARSIKTRGPWRADNSDEDESGGEGSGRFGRDLVSPDFVQPHHDPDALVCFRRPRNRATWFPPPCRS